jgi:hypothetical protein
MNKVLANGVNLARCRSSALAVAFKIGCPVGAVMTDVTTRIDDSVVERELATRVACELDTIPEEIGACPLPSWDLVRVAKDEIGVEVGIGDEVVSEDDNIEVDELDDDKLSVDSGSGSTS